MRAVWKLTGNERTSLRLSGNRFGVSILWTRFSATIWPWFLSATVWISMHEWERHPLAR